jgi:hypothetical protein
MKKLSFPKINLTKKQIIIISISAFILLASISISAILKNDTEGGNNTVNINREERQEGYADDTQEALSSTWQKIYSTETEPKILVYGEISDNPYGEGSQSLSLTEKCEYEDKDTEENTYTLGTAPIEVKNHCILNLAYQADLSETVDTLTAYLVLPDNSLIALSSNDFPSVQINIFDNEIRIVQLTGSAYYRISPKEYGDIFTVEIPLFSQIFTATGTEIFAEVGFTQEANSQYGFNEWEYAGGFFLYDGEGNISKRGSSEVLQTMNSSDDTNVYYNKLVNFVAEKVPLFSDTLDLLGRGDFLENQKTLSEKYGFGNFSEFTTDTLKAFVYNHVEDVYTQTVTSVEQMKAEEDAKWEEMQNDDDDDTSSGGSSSGSSSDMCYSSGASYQLCRMALDLNNGSAYMSGSQCCLVSTVSEPELVPVY